MILFRERTRSFGFPNSRGRPFATARISVTRISSSSRNSSLRSISRPKSRRRHRHRKFLCDDSILNQFRAEFPRAPNQLQSYSVRPGSIRPSHPPSSCPVARCGRCLDRSVIRPRAFSCVNDPRTIRVDPTPVAERAIDLDIFAGARARSFLRARAARRFQRAHRPGGFPPEQVRLQLLPANLRARLPVHQSSRALAACERSTNTARDDFPLDCPLRCPRPVAQTRAPMRPRLRSALRGCPRTDRLSTPSSITPSTQSPAQRRSRTPSRVRFSRRAPSFATAVSRLREFECSRVRFPPADRSEPIHARLPARKSIRVERHSVVPPSGRIRLRFGCPLRNRLAPPRVRFPAVAGFPYTELSWIDVPFGCPPVAPIRDR